MDFRQVAPDIQYWLQGLAESGSMRQNLDLLTTLEHTNDSTCCFFARKGRCVLGVPEFATYFRFENSEVRGKTEFRQPDPGYTLSRPAVLTPKFGLRSAGSDFPRTSGNRRYGCGVHGKKSTQKRAIKRQPVVLGNVMGIAVAASLYRMRSARHNSPLGIFERRLYSLAAAVSESASQ